MLTAAPLIHLAHTRHAFARPTADPVGGYVHESTPTGDAGCKTNGSRVDPRVGTIMVLKFLPIALAFALVATVTFASPAEEDDSRQPPPTSST